jgi:prepilin-type N-terminal cleavage/methylation domain-containing protein
MSTRKRWQKEQKILAQRIKASQRGAGFTLLEILVALAIFVIGALAIISIFPPALGVIQNSENRTIATNNSRNHLARLQANPRLVPDSVYHPLNYYAPDADDPFDNNPYGPFAGAVSGTRNRNDSLPRTIRENDFEASALSNIKRIVGEKHRVLSDGTRTYVVTEYSHTGGSGPNNSLTVFVEDFVDGVQIERDGRLDFTNARLRLLKTTNNQDVLFNERDYNRADRTALSTTPVTPVAPDGPFVHEARLAPVDWRGTDTIYYVTYRWIDTNGRTQGVVDEPLVMDDAVLDQAQRPRVLLGRSPGPASNDIIPGEISIRVKRQLISYNDRNSEGANDYEQQITDQAPPPVPAPTDDDENAESYSIRGYVPLWLNASPPGSADDLMTGSDLDYNTVSVNYSVRDWRWMINYDSPARVDDVNSLPAGIITLPQRTFDNEHLLDARSMQIDLNSTVYGLLTNTSGNTTSFDIARWNGDDTYTNDGRILTDTTAPVEDDKLGVNSRKGIIRYNLQGFAAPRARTAFWTLDGWAQQLSVAARSYIPFIDETSYPSNWRQAAEREAWREYYWAGPGNEELFFPPTEAGKSVMITFDYVVGGNHTTKSAVFTISDEIDDRPVGVPTTFEAETDKVCRLLIDVPEAPGFSVAAILGVRGLSVQSRTAWIDGGRYQQASASGYRPIDQS